MSFYTRLSSKDVYTANLTGSALVEWYSPFSTHYRGKLLVVLQQLSGPYSFTITLVEDRDYDSGVVTAFAIFYIDHPTLYLNGCPDYGIIKVPWVEFVAVHPEFRMV